MNKKRARKKREFSNTIERKGSFSTQNGKYKEILLGQKLIQILREKKNDTSGFILPVSLYVTNITEQQQQSQSPQQFPHPNLSFAQW